MTNLVTIFLYLPILGFFILARSSLSRAQTPLILVAASDSSSCEETYGFLPCTNSVVGNVFLMLVYGFFMFRSAKLLSNGSEVLLEIVGPGIIGGLLLPLLSAVPDAAIILASGISGSQETAQSQVSVGMGLLAGSTVMLLTILWGSCLVLGKCDLENSVSVDQKDTKTFSLTGSGLSTDVWSSYGARIMVISIIPLIIVQLPQFFESTSQSRLAILVSFIVSVTLLLSYCLYQVFQPWIQKRRIAYAKHKKVKSRIVQNLKINSLGRLVRDNGDPNVEEIQKLFKTIDQNSDGYLSLIELRALVLGIEFEDNRTNIDLSVRKIMKEFDESGDSQIDLHEFIVGISKWVRRDRRNRENPNRVFEFHEAEAEGVEENKSRNWNVFRAALMLLSGTFVAVVFADPLVNSVGSFSTASGIPSFFVSFVILPFASSSEVVSTLMFARRKRMRTASLTYSEIYGSVTISNTLSLSIFLGLVYVRELEWDFFSEVLIVVVVCVVVGLVGSFRTTFPLWMSLVAFGLYPCSLLLVYVLDYVLGMS